MGILSDSIKVKYQLKLFDVEDIERHGHDGSSDTSTYDINYGLKTMYNITRYYKVC